MSDIIREQTGIFAAPAGVDPEAQGEAIVAMDAREAARRLLSADLGSVAFRYFFTDPLTGRPFLVNSIEAAGDSTDGPATMDSIRDALGDCGTVPNFSYWYFDQRSLYPKMEA